MEIFLVAGILGLALIAAIVLIVTQLPKAFRRTTPDFSVSKAEVRLAFAVKDTLSNTQQRILALPKVLQPGSMYAQGDSIIVAEQAFSPGNYFVVYLSSPETGVTQVQVGVYSSMGFPMATWGVWFGERVKLHLNG